MVNVNMTDFEKYLKQHQNKQKTSKNIYYITIIGLMVLIALAVNTTSL